MTTEQEWRLARILLAAMAVCFALVLSGCASKVKSNFLEMTTTIDENGNPVTVQTGYDATTRIAPFSEADLTNHRFRYQVDGEQYIMVGQDAKGLDNTNQLEAFKAGMTTAQNTITAGMSLAAPIISDMVNKPKPPGPTTGEALTLSDIGQMFDQFQGNVTTVLQDLQRRIGALEPGIDVGED